MQNLLGEETDLFGLDWIERFLEWDFLSTGVSDLAVESIGNDTVDGLTAELGRDNQYGIMASLRCRIEQDVLEGLVLDRRLTPGEELPTFAIVCTDGPRSIVLSNSAIINTNSAWSLSGNMPPQVEMEVAVGSVVRSTGNPETPPAAATDWYLNGPVLGTFIWPRTTERRYHGQYVRTRTCSNGESPILVRYPPADDLVRQSTSLDHLLVTLNNMRVIVSKVPDQFTPDWSAGLGLEFRQDLGGIPDVEARKAIAEALSFLLGRQLLHIGFTTFGSLGQPLEEQAVDPWGDDVVATCQAPGWPPLRLPWEAAESERIKSSLIQSYVSLRDDLDLSDVLWAYWVGLRMPVGFELPLFGLALERLMAAWFRSSRSRSSGVYMSATEFEQLTAEPFTQVKRQLGVSKYGDRMMRRMRGAFQMGVNDRFETFFGELGLTLGQAEQLAVQRRNRCAHGGPIDPDQIREHIRLRHTYQSMVHRVLLKILGYTGSYIDYGTIGFPERALDECAGG